MFVPISNRLMFRRNVSARFHILMMFSYVRSIQLRTASRRSWNLSLTVFLMDSTVEAMKVLILSQLSYRNFATIPIGPVMTAMMVDPHSLKKSIMLSQTVVAVLLIASHVSEKKSLMPFQTLDPISPIDSHISDRRSLISSQF